MPSDFIYPPIIIIRQRAAELGPLSRRAPNRPDPTPRRRGRPRRLEGDQPSAGQIRRLKIIESAAFWTGAVGRRRLASAFGISINHASNDLSQYRKLAPKNLWYDIDAQCYRPTPDFSPQLGEAAAGDVLEQLAALADRSAEDRLASLGFDLPVATVKALPGGITSDVLALVTRAIAGGTGLDIVYQSMRTPEPVSRRFWPHALLFTGFRWLARGWDGSRQNWGDMALARMVEAKSVGDRSPMSPLNDTAWHRTLEIELEPNPKFSPSQRESLAREYGMHLDTEAGWLLRLPVREALIPYFLDYLNLRPRDHSKGRVPLLHLRNASAVFRFDRDGDNAENTANSKSNKKKRGAKKPPSDHIA